LLPGKLARTELEQIMLFSRLLKLNKLTNIVHSNSQYKKWQNFKNDQRSWQVAVSKNTNRTTNITLIKIHGLKFTWSH
jgi:hypothetical protein